MFSFRVKEAKTEAISMRRCALYFSWLSVFQNGFEVTKLNCCKQPIQPEDRVHCLVFFPRKLLLLELTFYEGTILILIHLYVDAFYRVSIAKTGVFSFRKVRSLLILIWEEWIPKKVSQAGGRAYSAVGGWVSSVGSSGWVGSCDCSSGIQFAAKVYKELLVPGLGPWIK